MDQEKIIVIANELEAKNCKIAFIIPKLESKIVNQIISIVKFILLNECRISNILLTLIFDVKW